MWAFFGRSLVQKAITLFFVSVVSFLIIHLAPGKPSQVDPLNPRFTPEIVERFRQEFHLDEPLVVQYALFYRACLPAASPPGKTIGRCWGKSGNGSSTACPCSLSARC
jgi:ABC-type dipeptide/oligopeptide/nickel transport system permease component